MDWAETNNAGVPGSLTPDNLCCQGVKQFLEEVNSEIPGDGKLVSWPTAVKFLNARKFDVKRAIELYRNHQLVRRREGLDDVCPYQESVRKELLTEKFTLLPGRDRSGAAVALFTARLHNPTLSTHRNVLRGLVFQLDAALESAETQKNGLVFVYDMTHSHYKNFDFDLCIKILNMLKGSYPARLSKVLIVTAPMWFKAPFKVLRLFVREKLRDRVYTLGASQLPLHISLDVLPRNLGGSGRVSHRDWMLSCLQRYNADHANHGSPHCVHCDDDHNTTNPTSCSQVVAKFFTSWDTEDALDASITSVTSSSMNSSSMMADNDESPSFQNSSDLCSEDEMNLRSPTHKRTQSSNSLNSLGNNSSDVGQPCKRLTTDSDRVSSAVVDYYDSVHNDTTQGLTVQELQASICEKRRTGLLHEYHKIKCEPPQGQFENSTIPVNLAKNRYTDVLCMDHSRVKLSIQDSVPHSDYINANLVDGYKQKNAYISTQGPLPKTFCDFWRMVWEQHVRVVVMTTRAQERGRTKCGQYWPIEGNEKHENFTVENRNAERMENFIITELTVTNEQTKESRDISHIQYISWPDYGVPKSAEAFLDFMYLVRDHQRSRTQAMSWTGHPNGPPIVVHCSAGIGRTGTFITMDICTKRIVDVGTVNVEQTVRLIRSQRAFSIQMPDQYVFCHLALLEWAHQHGLLQQINLHGFDDEDSDSD